MPTQCPHPGPLPRVGEGKSDVHSLAVRRSPSFPGSRDRLASLRRRQLAQAFPVGGARAGAAVELLRIEPRPHLPASRWGVDPPFHRIVRRGGWARPAPAGRETDVAGAEDNRRAARGAVAAAGRDAIRRRGAAGTRSVRRRRPGSCRSSPSRRRPATSRSRSTRGRARPRPAPRCRRRRATAGRAPRAAAGCSSGWPGTGRAPCGCSRRGPAAAAAAWRPAPGRSRSRHCGRPGGPGSGSRPLRRPARSASRRCGRACLPRPPLPAARRGRRSSVQCAAHAAGGAHPGR